MYKRVLLKLSGEALSSAESTFDGDVLKELAIKLKENVEAGAQIAIVVGGGNIIRGKYAQQFNLPRVLADKMGMLGTIINALAIKGALESVGIEGYVQSAIEMPRICDLVDYRKASNALANGKIVIYGGGTSNPYFSTDSAAALRACEVNCEAILMAKNGCDGVYDKDPNKYSDAKMYRSLTYQKVLEDHLQVIDSTAASLCNENGIETVVFNMNDLDNIARAINKEDIGTTIRR